MKKAPIQLFRFKWAVHVKYRQYASLLLQFYNFSKSARFSIGLPQSQGLETDWQPPGNHGCWGKMNNP